VRGKAASVFGIRQVDGTPGLVLDPGQRFRVSLANRSGEDTIIHWHGQTPPYGQDGVAEFGIPLIAAGADQDYDFVARPGTYWMHSHQGLQEQSLMAAPLIVRTEDDLRSDAQEVTVLLQDFTFRDPAEMLAGLTARPTGTRGCPTPCKATPCMHRACRWTWTCRWAQASTPRR
jgi:FtsP/CotA-like multicopper oxidase with cupredoxin domain